MTKKLLRVAISSCIIFSGLISNAANNVTYASLPEHGCFCEGPKPLTLQEEGYNIFFNLYWLTNGFGVFKDRANQFFLKEVSNLFCNPHFCKNFKPNDNMTGMDYFYHLLLTFFDANFYLYSNPLYLYKLSSNDELKQWGNVDPPINENKGEEIFIVFAPEKCRTDKSCVNIYSIVVVKDEGENIIDIILRTMMIDKYLCGGITGIEDFSHTDVSVYDVSLVTGQQPT